MTMSLLAGITAYARRWWRRNIIDDAPPYTDDEAERWRHRQHCTDPTCPCQR